MDVQKSNVQIIRERDELIQRRRDALRETLTTRKEGNIREKTGCADRQWERRCAERQIEEEKYLSPRSRHTLVEKKMRCLLNKKGCASIVSREKDALITRVKGGIDRERRTNTLIAEKRRDAPITRAKQECAGCDEI